jgi:hydrogenase expression/formation protein HypE
MGKEDRILLDHGSGGRASHELVREVFLPPLRNSLLAELDDSAVLEIGNQRIAFSTDSYTVDPIFFPGGDIGCLAVNGTVNDLAMRGATPLYLSAGFIIEEGFLISDLKRILASMKDAAMTAGVKVVAGDTKVVYRQDVDQIFINTSGIGVIGVNTNISGSNARAGDCVLISGAVGDHGVTILSKRGEFSFEAPVQSDSAPLNGLVREMMSVSDQIHTMRDPTRGGLATSLNEIAIQSNVGIELQEDRIPLHDSVVGACEILGLDPLYMANEGKLIAIVSPEDADKVLHCMKAHPYGGEASVIGRVVSENCGRVFMKTEIGGTRILDMLAGEQLPRIC